MDDHAYKGEFKRRSYADFLVKLYNVALDDEVVEWTFTNKPFDGRYLITTQYGYHKNILPPTV